MLWNIRIFEEPADYLFERHATSSTPPVEVAEGLITPALNEGRRQIALLTPDENDDADPVIVPDPEPNNKSMDELTTIVNQCLQEGHTFVALSAVRGALAGPGGEDPEVRLLGASIFELLNFHSMAVPVFRSTLDELTGLKLAAVQIRLSDSLTELDRKENQAELLTEALKCQELPTGMRVLGMVLLAQALGGEQAEEYLDQALDIGEEELGDHLSVSRALEIQADLLSDEDAAKAKSYYIHGGQMLARLQNPRFYFLNQKLAVHHLRHMEYEDAMGLVQVMFEMLDNAGAPRRAKVPYLAVASEAHHGLGEKEQSEKAMDTAMKIDPSEVARTMKMIQR